MENLKEELRRIANTAASELTAEDKSLIEQAAKDNGVKIRRKGCGSCYIDAAVEVYSKLNAEPEQEQEAEPEQDAVAEHYVLNKGVDVLVNGLRVNEATITDGLAKYLLSIGFSRKHFAKIPE